MAARNLTRNPQRSAIATGGTGFTILAFVFLFAYFDGFGEQAIENSTRYLTGHIQLERAGFRRDYPPALAVPDGPAIVQRVRAIPNVSAAAPRVTPGLVGVPSVSAPEPAWTRKLSAWPW